MTIDSSVSEYNQKLGFPERAIAEKLLNLFLDQLPDADAKVWHGHPVWFIGANPVAGYNLKKSGIEVLFWSGQSFKTDGLRPVGKFQAAGVSVPSLNEAESLPLKSWLDEARAIQWDYANLAKVRKLNKLTDF
jgi:hypothetical protein